MFPRYSYQPRNAHRHPLHARPLQEPQEAEAEAEVEAEAEAEAEEVEAEEEVEERTILLCPTSDSAETLLRYSQEKERKQTASSPNSNTII